MINTGTRVNGRYMETDRDNIRIPQHVAVIMDGNGRWAMKQGKPRAFGHKRGAEVVEQIMEDADDLGIRYLTVYAFSTENWNRPETEVSALMALFAQYLKTSIRKSMKNNVRCLMIGERSRLAPELVKTVEELEEATKDNTGLTFTVAINYGSRDEITRAVKKLAEEAAAHEISPEDITEDMITARLDTHLLPDPDLLIRTCGEQRLSNFLLWQSAYTEFYYTDKSWPEFDKAELVKAIEAYSTRDRKYGNLVTK